MRSNYHNRSPISKKQKLSFIFSSILKTLYETNHSEIDWHSIRDMILSFIDSLNNIFIDSMAEREVEVYTYTLNVQSIKMKIKFACKMKI